MKLRKVIFTGIIVGMISNLWGLLTCQGIFKWIYYVEPTSIYNKAMLKGDYAWLISMGTIKIIIAIMLTFGYAFIYKKISGNGAKKGILFGSLIWLTGMLPSRLLLYMSFNISSAIVIYWIVNDLISYILLGAILGILYKE